MAVIPDTTIQGTVLAKNIIVSGKINIINQKLPETRQSSASRWFGNNAMASEDVRAAFPFLAIRPA